MTTQNLLPIDDLTFAREVLASDQPFLLDVTAKWCGPCRAMLPTIHALADEQKGRLRVGTLDIDDAPATATALGIRVAPTLVLFAGGREVARHLGAASIAVIRGLIDRSTRELHATG